MYRLLAAAFIAFAVPAAAAPLTIAFTGIATPTGAILVSVFDSEAAFDRGGKPVASHMVAVAGPSAEVAVGDLPPGKYAVKAFHDVDGDGKMASNPFGMPLEPFAFSNDAVVEAGPARWAGAAFTVDAAGSRHTITIR